MLRKESYDDTACWVIESIPKENAPVVWGKQMLWISQDKYHMRKVAYYDEFNELINTMSTTDVKQIGGRSIPTRMEMQPADKPEQKTVLLYHNAAFDFDIPTSFFSQSNMKELRE